MPAAGAETSPAFFPCALLFVILHLCLYTASNSFNSYYDRDTGPIGGVEHPPMPTRELLHWSLGLDALGIAFGTNWAAFSAMAGPLLGANLAIEAIEQYMASGTIDPAVNGFTIENGRIVLSDYFGFSSIPPCSGAFCTPSPRPGFPEGC